MMEYRFGKSSLAFACVVVLSAFATSSWAHGPSGTVEIEETQAMLILGGDWGHGTLHFNGKDQKFKSKGVKLGGTVSTSYTCTEVSTI